jgi:hypothetical protein
MSQGRIDPVILIPSKHASTQELVADVTGANGTSASASRKDQDKKRTTTTSSSRRRRSFKRTRRSTPDSDESDSSTEDNQDETETQNSQDDKHTKEIEQLKAEDKTVEEVTESLAVQEEIEEVDYEAQRKRNILENQRLLQELGLDKSIVRKSFPPIVKTDDYEDNGDVSSDGEYNDKIGSNKPKKGRRFANNKVSWRNAGATVATRASKRIRGEAAIESKVDLEALERSLNGRTGINEDDGEEGSMRRGELATPPPKLGEYSRSLWKGRKQTTGFTMEMEIPSANVPLTVGKCLSSLCIQSVNTVFVDGVLIINVCRLNSLGSIATTIWELGSIYKGEKNKLKYWSGGGVCVYCQTLVLFKNFVDFIRECPNAMLVKPFSSNLRSP